MNCKQINAQEIEMGLGDFYSHSIRKEQKSIPLPYLRENDVIWETVIWRTINFREKFNQYFYYPTEEEGIDGRRNFAYVIWDAVVKGEISIYQDDELKIPLDNDEFVYQYTKADTMILEIVDENENYEYKSILVPKDFTSEDILQIRIKEAWYLDKQSTGQYVRILALALCKDYYKEIGLDREFMGTINLFWIPMLDPRTRNLLAKYEAYYEDNIAHLPSWEEIFTSRMFDSYITRETNRFNRSISDYLTGTDAILESERIENRLLEIGEDQWEW